MNRCTWAGRWLARMGACALGASLLLLARTGGASLGGDSASVEVDRAWAKGETRILVTGTHTVHEIYLPEGTLVSEYVSPAGVVFGVTWRGPFRPDIRQLLGAYFEEFREAAEASKRSHAGRGPLVVNHPNLVVEMTGHPRAFFGRAYVRSLLPQGFALDDIR